MILVCYHDGAYREREICGLCGQKWRERGGREFRRIIQESGVMFLGIFNNKTQLLTCDQQQSTTVNQSPPPLQKLLAIVPPHFARARRRWPFVAGQGRNKSKHNM